MINIVIYCFVFVLGTVFGSMINVLIYRLPIEEDVVVKPSHCVNCGKKIKAYDLIPILSYIILGGKCRHCGEKISIRYPLMEMLTGLAFVGIFFRFGWTIYPNSLQIIPSDTVMHLAAVFALAVIFITVFVIDLYHYIIPNEMIIAGLISGLIFAVLKCLKFYFLGFSIIQPISFKADFLIDAGLGLLVGFVSFLLIVLIGEWIMKAEVIGMGDVKLMGVVGLFLGLKLTILSMFLAFITGAVISLFLLATKIKSRKDMIPFGPFIVLGSTIAMIWGMQILTWYFNLGKL
jgi:leader peptidase (prepilin peptidase)/N-methyltransferase